MRVARSCPLWFTGVGRAVLSIVLGWTGPPLTSSYAAAEAENVISRGVDFWGESTLLNKPGYAARCGEILRACRRSLLPLRLGPGVGLQ